MSGASQLDCYNLSLSYLDLSQRVLSLTENSPQAGYCNQMWDRARKLVLEQCYWSFATLASALSLLLDQQTITAASALIMPGWRFIYARPSTALKVQAVTTSLGLRSNPQMGFYWSQGSPRTGTFRPAWTEMLDQVNTPPGQTIDILTDQSAAWAVYTTDPPNVAILPETFIDCVAWQMCVLISGPLSASNSAKQNALKMSTLSLSRALAQNLNERQDDPYPESVSTLARL